MARDLLRLRKIYDKTDGFCLICHRKLSFKNYGKHGSKGSWHMEHSNPKAKGGSDHLKNLFAACIECNIEKSTLTTRTARGYHGNTRAPYSKTKKKKIKAGNTTAGAVIGGGIGLMIGGPAGGFVGSFVGGLIGKGSSPKK